MWNQPNDSIITNEKKYELAVSILHDLNAHFHNWIKSLLIINSSICVAIYAVLNKHNTDSLFILTSIPILLSLFGIIVTIYIKKFIVRNRGWHKSYIDDLCKLEITNPIVFVCNKSVGGNNEFDSLKYQVGNLCKSIVLLWLIFIIIYIIQIFYCFN